MKILLVEDDSALRGALEELLCREGYDVVKASNVRTAREGMDSTIDLVILDVGLPDGDGVELCRSWRTEGVQTPILFLTAKDEEMDVVRGLDSGGNDYVTKPFRMQELLSRIRALLRRNQRDTSHGINFPLPFVVGRNIDVVFLTPLPDTQSTVPALGYDLYPLCQFVLLVVRL